MQTRRDRRDPIPRGLAILPGNAMNDSGNWIVMMQSGSRKGRDLRIQQAGEGAPVDLDSIPFSHLYLRFGAGE